MKWKQKSERVLCRWSFANETLAAAFHYVIRVQSKDRVAQLVKIPPLRSG